MFELCTQTIQKGRRESELQTILMAFANANDLFDTGYRSTLNPLIIASGTNSSLPHAQVTKRKFADGDMITVEPGIYIPKKFGVRIEDSLIVKSRAAVMHKFTKEIGRASCRERV